MALVQKGPSKKKKKILTLVLSLTILTTLGALYFGVIRKSASPLPEKPNESAVVAPELQQEVSSEAKPGESDSLVKLVELFRASPQWQALKLASQIATTSPSQTGRSDPFEVIPEFDPESYGKAGIASQLQEAGRKEEEE